jgi:hypothetical protein
VPVEGIAEDLLGLCIWSTFSRRGLEMMGREDFVTAIRNRNAARICFLLLGTDDPPRVARGAGTENELWDYKQDVPSDAVGWARISRHVLAMHNNRGGALLFGIRDGDLSFCGASARVDSKVFNEKIRRYVGDQIWVDFHREWIQPDQRYLGLAIVPPRGPVLGYFREDAPLIDGKREFNKGDSATRVGDSSVVLSHHEAAARQASLATGPVVGSPYAIDLPFFRVLALETHEFIRRDDLGAQVERALVDPRTSVTSLIGIGGSGKTTLATWAVLRAHERRRFDAVVSLTAKDRELGTLGIQSLTSASTTFEVLLDTVLVVLGFKELAEAPVEEREAEVRSLLENSNALLYVDNLETVDDPRVIEREAIGTVDAVGDSCLTLHEYPPAPIIAFLVVGEDLGMLGYEGLEHMLRLVSLFVHWDEGVALPQEDRAHLSGAYYYLVDFVPDSQLMLFQISEALPER